MAAATRRAGIDDALALTSEHAVHLRAGRRTQTVTPRQLKESLAALTETIESASLSEEMLATQLPELAREAAIMVDIAKAIALERSDGSGSNCIVLVEGEPGRNRGASRGLRVFGRDRRVRTNSAARPGDRLPRDGDGDGVWLYVRPGAPIALDRISHFRIPSWIAFATTFLASEAPLASFFAIAKGDIPARHWFTARTRRDSWSPAARP